MNVQAFLKLRGTEFEILDHGPTYSAQTLAQAVHVPGKDVAKTVLLCADGDYVLAVLPATYQIDFDKASRLLGLDFVELASERECGEVFNDCELGALPPFGSHYGLKTIVDESLAEDEEIVFEGNSHAEAIRMRMRDYQTLEQPLVGRFTYGF